MEDPVPRQPDYNAISIALGTLSQEVIHIKNAPPHIEQFRSLLRDELKIVQDDFTKKWDDNKAAIDGLTKKVDDLTQKVDNNIQAVNDLRVDFTTQFQLVPMRIHNYACPVGSALMYPPGVDTTPLPQTKEDLLSATGNMIDTVATALGLPPMSGSVVQRRDRVKQYLGV